ncbi:hypothetical protein [Streptomyces abikoensis]
MQTIAEKIAKEYTVLRNETAENMINYDLASRLPCEIDSARILRAVVTLAVDEEEVEQAEKRSALRRQLALESLAREQSATQVAFMREEILRDPVNARLHWLLKNPQCEVADEATWLELVGQVSAWSDDSRWVHIARLTETFLSGLSRENRRDLLGVVRQVFSGYGRADLAAEISDDFLRDDE